MLKIQIQIQMVLEAIDQNKWGKKKVGHQLVAVGSFLLCGLFGKKYIKTWKEGRRGGMEAI